MNVPRLVITINPLDAAELFMFQDKNLDLEEDMRFIDDIYCHIATTISTLWGVNGVEFELG